SRKSPTTELFDVDSRRISIMWNAKEHHSECPGIIPRIIRRTYWDSELLHLVLLVIVS
ncbi:hypothetical protein Tco_0043536, partial [Tanacetum coccineum]